MKLIYFILKRVLLLIPVLIGVTLLTFTISNIVPADPVKAALGPRANKETIAAMKKKLNLDKPIYVQYIKYMGGVLKGDFGTSIFTNRPVSTDLKIYFPATFELTTFSMMLCLIFGIPFGVLAATHKDKLADHLTRVFSLFGISIPVFWLGLLMLLFFYYKLGIMPGVGRISPNISPPQHITGLYIIDSILTGNWVTLKNCLSHIIMPGTCLAFAVMGMISRMTRSSMLNVLGEDYIRTALAKGITWNKVKYQHALPNAIIPVITISGSLYGQLLAGAVLTETIFSWPGLGLYSVTSILYLDFQPVMGFTILVAIIFVSVNLFVDILYVAFDPRIRL